jgi:hypothetical protein
MQQQAMAAQWQQAKAQHELGSRQVELGEDALTMQGIGMGLGAAGSFMGGMMSGKDLKFAIDNSSPQAQREIAGNMAHVAYGREPETRAGRMAEVYQPTPRGGQAYADQPMSPRELAMMQRGRAEDKYAAYAEQQNRAAEQAYLADAANLEAVGYEPGQEEFAGFDYVPEKQYEPFEPGYEEIYGPPPQEQKTPSGKPQFEGLVGSRAEEGGLGEATGGGGMAGGMAGALGGSGGDFDAVEAGFVEKPGTVTHGLEEDIYEEPAAAGLPGTDPEGMAYPTIQELMAMEQPEWAIESGENLKQAIETLTPEQQAEIADREQMFKETKGEATKQSRLKGALATIIIPPAGAAGQMGAELQRQVDVTGPPRRALAYRGPEQAPMTAQGGESARMTQILRARAERLEDEELRRQQLPADWGTRREIGPREATYHPPSEYQRGGTIRPATPSDRYAAATQAPMTAPTRGWKETPPEITMTPQAGEELARQLRLKEFEYNRRAQAAGAPPGRRRGVMAEQYEKGGKAGRRVVKEAPVGKVLDRDEVMTTNAGLIGNLQRQIDELKKGKQ